MDPLLYCPRAQFEILCCAKAPGLDDRKSPNIDNMGRLTIVQPRELSLCTKPQIVPAGSITALTATALLLYLGYTMIYPERF